MMKPKSQAYIYLEQELTYLMVTVTLTNNEDWDLWQNTLVDHLKSSDFLQNEYNASVKQDSAIIGLIDKQVDKIDSNVTSLEGVGEAAEKYGLATRGLALKKEPILVVKPLEPQKIKSWPKLKLLYPLAAIAGFFVALVIAILLEFNRIVKKREVSGSSKSS